MTQSEGGSPSSSAQISNELVHLVREYTGRGPTQAKTTVSGDLAVCIMRDTMTRAERTLVEHGYADRVLASRHHVQRVMREAMTAVVERHLDRRVTAFMSDNHLDPDVAAEVFVLEAR